MRLKNSKIKETVCLQNCLLWTKAKAEANKRNFENISEAVKELPLYWLARKCCLSQDQDKLIWIFPSCHELLRCERWNFCPKMLIYCLLQPKSYPTVLVAVFIEQPTPFFEEFLEKLHNIEYPKEKLHLFVHNSVSGVCLSVIKQLARSLLRGFISDRSFGFWYEGGNWTVYVVIMVKLFVRYLYELGE